jgi:serine/threonine protein kinase/DNA-binding beta-propeller fold protein YncE
MPNNFGKYEVIAEIGRGGMGVIYKAQDPRLNRFVAIKQLILDHVDPDKKEEFKERFRREAILAAGLNHPNLISIYDVFIGDSVEDNSYYVMEYLEGHSFRRELEIRPGNRLTPDEFYPIFKQVCEGLAAAHDMNLVHRDIKPDNIFLLPGGKVKLTDFGIARSSEQENSNLTKPGVMLGTLSYVSPEQLQDARNVDHRADIYSLGVVMYEALAGQLPFTGEGLTSTLMAIVSRDARPVNEVCPEIGADISSVVTKSMRKQATERYLSVLEFLRDYEKALNLVKSTPSSGIRIPVANPATSVGGNFLPGVPVQGPPGPARTAGIPVSDNAASKSGLGKPWTAQRQKELGTTGGGADESSELAKPIGTIGRSGDEKGSFNEPAVICARFGKIIVADTVRRKFQIFTREGKFLAESQAVPATKGTKTAGGAFSKPSAISIDARGRIYATDSGDHFIRVFDGQGKFSKEITNRGGKDGGLAGIICDPTGLLYVSDPDNGCVHVMNAENGQWLRKVGTKGTNDGQLQLPSGLALDRFNQLYVVDYSTSRVSVFSKAGIFQRAFGGKGTGKGLFNVPRGIAIDRFDRLYIADSLNHRVQVFNTNGQYLFFFGGRGQESGKFMGPADLSIDPENNCLYVADRGNCRVQIFELIQG